MRDMQQVYVYRWIVGYKLKVWAILEFKNNILYLTFECVI